jgi:hypothetical protein
VRFTLNGQQLELTARMSRTRLHTVSPEPVQDYGVQIGLARYPVKQAGRARKSGTIYRLQGSSAQPRGFR